jgi:hypothetical protein
MRCTLPEPLSLAILLVLECIAGLLRWAHKVLDKNRDDGGFARASGLTDQINELNSQCKFTEACLREIQGLAPVVFPLIRLQLLRNSREIEAFFLRGGLGVLGSLQYNVLYFNAVHASSAAVI